MKPPVLAKVLSRSLAHSQISFQAKSTEAIRTATFAAIGSEAGSRDRVATLERPAKARCAPQR
jgi:hypothetical protein